MTAHAAARQFDKASTLFAEARSDWLDSFSRLEVAVYRFELRCCAAPLPRGTPLKQRLPALLSNCGGSNVPVQELQKLVRECEALLPLRATIVHSAMKTGMRDAGEVAIFQNAFDLAHAVPVFAEMTPREFARGINSLGRLANAFAKLGAKPSSPPPREPA